MEAEFLVRRPDVTIHSLSRIYVAKEFLHIDSVMILEWKTWIEGGVSIPRAWYLVLRTTIGILGP